MKSGELLAAYEQLVHDMLGWAVEATAQQSQHWLAVDGFADRWEALISAGPHPLRPISSELNEGHDNAETAPTQS